MNLLLLWARPRVPAMLAVGLLCLLAGCPASGDPRPRVASLRIDAPVRELMWSDSERALLALSEEGHRIAKIAPPEQNSDQSSTVESTMSGRFPGRIESLATSATGDDVVYLAQPDRGRIAVVDVDDLRQVRTLRMGTSPSQITTDEGSKTLLALAADGSTVTGMDLRNGKRVPPEDVGAGPEAEVHGAHRGRLIEYHVAGPSGIARYKGSPHSVQNKGEIDVRAGEATGDLAKVSRLYVAEKDTDRLLAVDANRNDEGLEVVAESRFGAPIHHLGVDETRLYAATEDRLITLETNSFEGYENRRFPVVESIDYRAALPRTALQAPLAGLAVGPDRIYLAVRGHPFLLSISKPTP